MQHTLYLAALVQICLSGSILAALLLWLFVTHTLGTRRQAAARQLDRDLADCFSNALPQALLLTCFTEPLFYRPLTVFWRCSALLTLWKPSSWGSIRRKAF